MCLQAEPAAKKFNEEALKPAAQNLAENAPKYADQVNEQLTKSAKTVGENAVPVTEDVTENYIKPTAQVD